MPRQYVSTFSAVAITAAQDIFELTAPAAGVARLVGVIFNQSSDSGDAQAESLDIKIVRGHTTSGSGGSAFTPIPLNSADTAAGSACEINNTTIASAGTAVNLLADAPNIQIGEMIWFPPEMRPTARNSERIVVRISAPADSITASATLYFEEE